MQNVVQFWYKFRINCTKKYKYGLYKTAIKNPETLDFTGLFKDFGLSSKVTPTGIEPVPKLSNPLYLLDSFFVWYNFGST